MKILESPSFTAHPANPEDFGTIEGRHGVVMHFDTTDHFAAYKYAKGLSLRLNLHTDELSALKSFLNDKEFKHDRGHQNNYLETHVETYISNFYKGEEN